MEQQPCSLLSITKIITWFSRFGIFQDQSSNFKAFANETTDDSLCWKDVGWLRPITNLPNLIKGVIFCEDSKLEIDDIHIYSFACEINEILSSAAIKAVQVGVFWDYCLPSQCSLARFSSHDSVLEEVMTISFTLSLTLRFTCKYDRTFKKYSYKSLAVFQQVVHAVEGKIHVLMEGGVRQGTDIFKALTVDPRLEGLLSMASHRARRVIEMLKDEFELTMALSGCPNVKHITKNHVRTERDRLH
ncbi:hypothetical protein Pint_29269 [Pistacia integerrima]|uniref:Uncharacterized protein n=1 Tax=Pistacia integerrima TaxID=434235 RepID=A0ACC0X309_9ROSI|nr:hypothetical protein Pint_29269 [Pistacia integerrima]